MCSLIFLHFIRIGLNFHPTNALRIALCDCVSDNSVSDFAGDITRQIVSCDCLCLHALIWARKELCGMVTWGEERSGSPRTTAVTSSLVTGGQKSQKSVLRGVPHCWMPRTADTYCPWSRAPSYFFRGHQLGSSSTLQISEPFNVNS